MAILTVFWLIFVISPQLGGEIGQDIFDANLLTLLVVITIPLYHRIQSRRVNRRLLHTPAETPVVRPQLVRPTRPIRFPLDTAQNRVKLFLVILLILIGIGIIGAALPMDGQTAAAKFELLRGHLGGNGRPTAESIWTNNARVALFGFIPGYGLNVEVSAALNTGEAFQAISMVSNNSTGVTLYLRTMLTPFYWLEQFCYALAPTAGIALLSRSNRPRIRREIVLFLPTALIVVGILYVSAIIEMSYIGI